MSSTTIAEGVVHTVPQDMRKALKSSPSSLTTWNSITPLARNEWICWVESVKKQETRDHHIKRLIEDLSKGKRRPCCWSGCIHRTDKELNSTQKWLLERNSAK